MATGAEINEVRQNTNEPNNDTWSDVAIGALVDAGSVESASAAIWRQKAAQYADLVDTSEAGSSRKLSDLHKNALGMAETWEAQVPGATVIRDKPRVSKIVRT